MARFIRLSLAALLVMSVAACARYSMVPPQRTPVKSSFTVEPGQAWNKINLQFGSAASHPVEAWTADGDQLNMMLFFAGVADGQTLMPPPRDEDKAKRLPAFRSSMSANEVKDVIEATLGQFMNSALVETRNLRPAVFGGHDGYRFDFSLVGKDEVDRQGIAVGAVVDGKLHSVVFMGTRLYHYGLRLQDAEHIVSSVQFVKN